MKYLTFLLGQATTNRKIHSKFYRNLLKSVEADSINGQGIQFLPFLISSLGPTGQGKNQNSTAVSRIVLMEYSKLEVLAIVKEETVSQVMGQSISLIEDVSKMFWLNGKQCRH